MADTNLMTIPGQIDPVPVARDITPRADGRTDLLGLPRERIRDLFGRHVGRDVAEAASARGDGIRLGGEVRPVAVLFIDLVGFNLRC